MEGCRGSHDEKQMLYCGPLARAIFRLVFRRGAKQAD